MDPTTLALLVIGIIIVIGLIAKVIFKKFKIPDVLLLIIVGAVLGYFNLVPSLSENSGIMKVLLMFALIYVVFNGGLPISIKAIFSSAKWAFLSSLINFTGISVIIGLIIYAFGFDFKISLTGGMLMCVMDGSIINSILENFKFSKRGEAFVQIESAIIDIFVIVGVVTLWVENLSVGDFSQQVATFLILSSGLGILFGLMWGFFIKKIGNMEHVSLTTLAILLLVYVSAEYFHGNGVIGVFAFAITLGNLKTLSKLVYKKEAEGIGSFTREQKIFFNDLAFLLRTLLFVFIGTLIDFSLIWYLLLGFLLALISIIIRSFIFKVVETKEIADKEKNMIQTMAAKGLTPIVMMSLVKGSPAFNNIIIGGIFFSVLMTSIMLFLIQKDKFENISDLIISIFHKKRIADEINL